MRFILTFAAASGFLMLTPLIHSGMPKTLNTIADTRVTIVEKNSSWPQLIVSYARGAADT